MSSGGVGSGGQAAGAPPGKQVPRDIIVMQALLRDMGITKFETRVLYQMHEYVYRTIPNYP